MKSLKLNFNRILLQYLKDLRARWNLVQSNRNARRQVLLTVRIARSEKKLRTLQTSLRSLGIATVITGALTFGPLNAEAQATFTPPSQNPFSIQPISAGYSKPTFGDLDGDGDLDMLSGAEDGSFYYYQNTGTATAPTYAAPSTNPFGISGISSYYSTPAWIDLDADGDLDLVSGMALGGFVYYQNTGTSSSPQFAAPVSNPFGLSSPGYKTVPSLVDLDNDGDADLMSGEYYGDFYYYQNIGTATSPSFSSAQTNPFGLTGISGYSTASLADLDIDGDLDLMSGDDNGNFFYHANNGNAVTPNFGVFQQNPFNIIPASDYSNPTFADIDGDGDMDMITGDGNGNFLFYQNASCLNSSVTVVGMTLTAQQFGGTYQWVTCPNYTAAPGVNTNQSYNAPSNGSYAVIINFNGCVDTSACTPVLSVGSSNIKTSAIQIYPNPTQGVFTIQLPTDAEVILRNEIGQMVKSISVIARTNYPITVDDLPSGVYFLEALMGQEFIREKITIIK